MESFVGHNFILEHPVYSRSPINTRPLITPLLLGFFSFSPLSTLIMIVFPDVRFDSFLKDISPMVGTSQSMPVGDWRGEGKPALCPGGKGMKCHSQKFFIFAAEKDIEKLT